ncbi:MAG TPA: hypothetical protein VIK14_04955, partial [Ignavibacteria bacterium]
MKLSKYISKILDILIALVLLLFFASFGFRDGRTSGWYQQFFPNLNGSTITSMAFLDSLTGFAVTNSNSLLQEYILRTTNGGDNWIINYTYNTPNSNWSYIKIGFINSSTGFAFSWAEMFKTTNAGNNWELIINNLYADDIAIINIDTMLAVKSNGFDGGVYQSTNGGLNWQLIWGGGGSGMPSRIYMFNKYLGFDLGDAMRRTTDGGFNWIEITGEAYRDIKFIDTLTGWKTSGADQMKKTTDGGLTWLTQQLPAVSPYFSWMNLSIVNKDTVWMCGGVKSINGFNYGIMFKTTDGGNNWGFQYADTSIKLMEYAYINFVNRNIGWSYRRITGGVHTLVGGNDTTFFTGIKLVENFIPSGYTLGQNYPNPFNPSTNIPFELNESGYIILKVYDITGRT